MVDAFVRVTEVKKGVVEYSFWIAHQEKSTPRERQEAAGLMWDMRKTVNSRKEQIEGGQK